MKNTLILLLILLTSVLHISCNETDSISGINRGVELYEIEEYETINNTDQIDESTVKAKDSPLLNYEDLISYNSKVYKFEISEQAEQLLENIQDLSGAFAIKVDNELIYTGYFVPGYSSRLYAWNIIDPIMSSFSGECFVRRISFQGGSQPSYGDKRNDPRILDAFRTAGKLIE